MSITAALVLFAVLWFFTLFIVLPIRFKSQGDDGNVIAGTPESAPANAQMSKKFKITTLVAAIAWAVIAGVIWSGWITVEDFDLFTRFGGELHRGRD